MTRLLLSCLLVVLAVPVCARAQDEKKDTTEKGKDLKETVKDSERALLDEVDRLKKAIGLGADEKRADEKRAHEKKLDERTGRPGVEPSWDTCGDPGCDRCKRHEFCRRRAEKIQAACQRVLGRKKDLEERFVQLRLDYRKLTGFLAAESEKLARDAESPPDSEGLPREDLEALKRSYLEMASHVRDLKPAYELRFKAIEKNEASALAQLAILDSKSSILKDALEVLRATDDLSELKKEIATLEENLSDMSSAIDKALAAFGDLAKTIRVEK